MQLLTNEDVDYELRLRPQMKGFFEMHESIF